MQRIGIPEVRIYLNVALTLHSYSKEIFVNLKTSNCWLLWHFNSVKYWFATGDCKRRAEQAPPPTQAAFFFLFFSSHFLSVSPAGCYWNFDKLFHCLRSDTKEGLFHFSFLKMREFQHHWRQFNENSLDIIYFTVSVQKGKKNKIRKSLCTCLDFGRHHI